MKKVSLNVLLFIVPIILFSQQISNPNFALASHPMKVTKIEYTENQLIIELSIENQSETGTFCADKNIFIQAIGSKKKYQLKYSQGIPVCPSSYEFKYVGELLTFQLYFPKISADTKYINLVEDCDQYCFSIKGIILNTEMNKEIDLGYDYYTKGKLDFALQAFKIALENNPDYPFGFIHFNIIQILAEKNDFRTAKIWYNKILSSNFEDKNELISRLKTQSYYNKIIQ